MPNRRDYPSPVSEPRIRQLIQDAVKQEVKRLINSDDDIQAQLDALAIDDLSDVVITSAMTDEFLRFNGSNWVNTAVSIPSSLNDLSDVVLGTPTNDQFLRYNGSNWVNETVSIPSTLDDLSDVNAPTPNGGDVLEWDNINSEWIAAAPSGGPSDLNGLTDVVITSPANKEYIRYNSGSGDWENVVPAFADISEIDSSLSPSDGDLLQYNSTSGVWESLTLSSGRAYMSAHVNMPVTNLVTAELDSVDYDTDSAFDTTNFKLVIPRDGTYLLLAVFDVQPDSASATLSQGLIKVNGFTEIQGNEANAGAFNNRWTVSIVLPLSTNDEVTLIGRILGDDGTLQGTVPERTSLTWAQLA